jgi:DEAD/DEAH box helicase domain-containing protein
MNPTQLHGRKIAVFDIEIKKDPMSCTNKWDSHDEMGIAVLCLFDYSTMRYRLFDDKNGSEACEILNTYDLIVGFNTVKFDWKVLKATWPYSGERYSSDYDILREIWRSKGLDPDHFNPRTHGGFKLDDVARETINMAKTGDGARAPYLFQEGKYADLHDYVLQDVNVERSLFEHVCQHGYIIRNEQLIRLTPPVIR